MAQRLAAPLHVNLQLHEEEECCSWRLFQDLQFGAANPRSHEQRPSRLEHFPRVLQVTSSVQNVSHLRDSDQCRHRESAVSAAALLAAWFVFFPLCWRWRIAPSTVVPHRARAIPDRRAMPIAVAGGRGAAERLAAGPEVVCIAHGARRPSPRLKNTHGRLLVC